MRWSHLLPRIFEDVEKRRSSVHILMFGWRAPSGWRSQHWLERKIAEEVEVRVIVDGLSTARTTARPGRWHAAGRAGARMRIMNDVLSAGQNGLYPDDLHVDWRRDEVGRADHRKLYVINGVDGVDGGAGIEDHFENSGFHDVMTRVTGDVVRQTASGLPDEFPGARHPAANRPVGVLPRTRRRKDRLEQQYALSQVIPVDSSHASQAIREQIDERHKRLDLMNPYAHGRGHASAVRAPPHSGVRVRVVILPKSNNDQATAALEHWSPALMEAGVELSGLPGTVVHAKVVVADDVVRLGTVNLDSVGTLPQLGDHDDRSQPRVRCIPRDASVGSPDIAHSKPGEAASGTHERLETGIRTS